MDSQIKKGASTLVTQCPKCKHPKTSHMRPPRVDEGRLRGSMKPVFSICRECWKVNKECKYYSKK